MPIRAKSKQKKIIKLFTRRPVVEAGSEACKYDNNCEKFHGEINFKIRLKLSNYFLGNNTSHITQFTVIMKEMNRSI